MIFSIAYKDSTTLSLPPKKPISIVNISNILNKDLISLKGDKHD